MAPLRELCSVLIIGLVLAAGCTSSEVQRTAAETSVVPSRTDVTLAATLGCPTYNERARACLLLKVEYGAAAVSIDRPALNIALVLDRSSSMRRDDKLALALAAARGVVQQMTERDTLAIIAVNEQATVLSAAGRVVNKAFLYHRLEDIYPSGQADLNAGLREGIAQVQQVSAAGQVRHVLLLTDALANGGRTSAALQKSTQEASSLGIAVSTFGVGSDHNGRLLAALAALGGGRYAYIKTPEGISGALASILPDAPPTVARDVAVRVTMAQGLIGKLYGQLPAPPTSTQLLPIGDLRANERGFVVAALEPTAFAFGTTIQAKVRLDFLDPLTNQSQSKEIEVRSAYAPDFDATVQEGRTRLAMLSDVLSALELADSAARGLDLARYREVKASFDPLYRRANEYALQNRDQELLNQVFVLGHLIGELDAAYGQGLLHEHEQARARFYGERDYLQYLLTHHRQ